MSNTDDICKIPIQNPSHFVNSTEVNPSRLLMAGMAMQGILANDKLVDGLFYSVPSWVCENALNLADELIEQAAK